MGSLVPKDRGREMEQERKCREGERGENKIPGSSGIELLGEGQPSWAGKFRAEGRHAKHALYQVGTAGCWENPEARSTLVC